MKITQIKSLWPENKDFKLYRDNTGNQYIFALFNSFKYKTEW